MQCSGSSEYDRRERGETNRLLHQSLRLLLPYCQTGRQVSLFLPNTANHHYPTFCFPQGVFIPVGQFVWSESADGLRLIFVFPLFRVGLRRNSSMWELSFRHWSEIMLITSPLPQAFTKHLERFTICMHIF